MPVDFQDSCYWVLLVWGVFSVSKTIIPDAQEHFLTHSTRRDIYLVGGLGFTHFKRRRQGNRQVDGTELLGVPEYRGQRPTLKNLLTPATGVAAPRQWRPRRSGTACHTRRPYAGSWGALFATRGRPGWSRKRAPAGRAWCGRWRDQTTGVGSPRPGGSAPPER